MNLRKRQLLEQVMTVNRHMGDELLEESEEEQLQVCIGTVRNNLTPKQLDTLGKPRNMISNNTNTDDTAMSERRSTQSEEGRLKEQQRAPYGGLDNDQVIGNKWKFLSWNAHTKSQELILIPIQDEMSREALKEIQNFKKVCTSQEIQKQERKIGKKWKRSGSKGNKIDAMISNN